MRRWVSWSTRLLVSSSQPLQSQDVQAQNLPVEQTAQVIQVPQILYKTDTKCHIVSWETE